MEVALCRRTPTFASLVEPEMSGEPAKPGSNFQVLCKLCTLLSFPTRAPRHLPWHSLLCAPGWSLLAGCTPPRAVPRGLSPHRATKDATARGLGKRTHQKNPAGVLLPSYPRGCVQTLEHPHLDFHQGTVHSAPCAQVPSWCPVPPGGGGLNGQSSEDDLIATVMSPQCQHHSPCPGPQGWLQRCGAFRGDNQSRRPHVQGTLSHLELGSGAPGLS